MNNHVIFNESIHLGNVHEVREKLLEIIRSDKSVSINIDPSNIPDLAGLQLLTSLCRNQKKAEKLKIHFDDELRGYFSRYGFNCLFSN